MVSPPVFFEEKVAAGDGWHMLWLWRETKTAAVLSF